MNYAVRPSRPGATWLIPASILVAAAYGTVSAVLGGSVALLLFAPLLPVLFVFRDFRIGVILLALLLPLQRTPMLPSFTGFNIVNYLTLATMAALIARVYFQPIRLAPFPHVFWWAYLLPIVLAGLLGVTRIDEVPARSLLLIGTAYATPKAYLAGLVIKPLFLIPAGWMLGTAAINSKRPATLVGVLAAAALLPALAIIAFVAYNGFDLGALSDSASRGTLDALGMHANDFGMLLGSSFAVLLFLLPALRGVAAAALLACLGCLLLALMLTFSRGGFALAAFGILAFALLERKPRILFLTALFTLAGLAVAPEAVWDRIGTGANESLASILSGSRQDMLTAGRVWLWSHLVPEFWKSPLWGSGVGSTAWSDLVKSGAVFYNHPHNLYLRILLDVGILGMALFAVFFIYLFRRLRQTARAPATPPLFAALARGTLVPLVGVVLPGLPKGQSSADAETSILWLAIGLLLPFFPARAAAAAPAAAPGGAFPPGMYHGSR